MFFGGVFFLGLCRNYFVGLFSVRNSLTLFLCSVDVSQVIICFDFRASLYKNFDKIIRTVSVDWLLIRNCNILKLINFLKMPMILFLVSL
jgi:hypothetical protein